MEEMQFQTQLPSQESVSQLPSKKPIKQIIKVIIGIIIFIVIGFVISLYTRAFDPLWNPFRPEPEEVIEEMALRMESLKTLHSEVKIDFIAKEDTKEDFKILMSFGSDSDNTDPKNPKSVGDFDIVSAVEGIQFSLVGESKTIGEISYFKLTTIPALPVLEPFFQMMGIDLKEFKDQWIKIDPESIKNWQIDLLKSTGAWAPEMEEMFKKQTETQEEMQEKIKNLIVGRKFYLIKEELLDEKIGDKKVYHYLVGLNKEEVKKLILEILGIYQEKMIESMTEIMPEQFRTSPEEIEKEKQKAIEEMKKDLNELFEKAGEINGELWIGKKDILLYRIKGEKEIDLSKIEPGEKGKIIIKINLNFSNFNQPVKIEAPKDYKIFEEIFPLGGMISESLLESQSKAKDARIIADMMQVRTIAEMIYDDSNYSYENLCTEPPAKKLNKNMPSYGTMLSTIEDDIEVQQGGVLNLTCLDTKDSYCITVDLALADKGKYCVDSSGIAKEVEENKTCLGTETLQNPYRCP